MRSRLLRGWYLVFAGITFALLAMQSPTDWRVWFVAVLLGVVAFVVDSVCWRVASAVGLVTHVELATLVTLVWACEAALMMFAAAAFGGNMRDGFPVVWPRWTEAFGMIGTVLVFSWFAFTTGASHATRT